MGADPTTVYGERAARFAAERERAERAATLASHARLATFALAVAGGIWAEQTAARAAFALLSLAAAAFLGAVLVHRSRRDEAERLGALERLNRLGPARIARDWDALPVATPPADAAVHPYAEDLDVFGRAGLVQILGPIGTPAGRATLHAWLLEPSTPDTLAARQAAVAELAAHVDLRDRVASHALRAGTVRASELAPLVRWAEGGPPPGPGPATRIVAWALPLATWLLAALDLAGVVERGWWVLGVLAATVLTIAGPGARARSAFTRAFAREGIFEGFPDLLHAIAAADLKAPLLTELQAELLADGLDPADRIADLDRLMHLSDLRRSGMLYLPIQLATLWDLHVHAAMERWRAGVGARLSGWLEAAGTFEALSALATLAHDQPGWAMPVLDGEPTLRAEALGHPLLADDVRVANDVAVGPPGTFLHVTGSNMSGKSTLLRAIGLNAVLAQAGGPVCARALRMPALDVRSSIRIRDSLERGVSLFMAELERLKGVVDAADAGSDRRVLFLLDEILHGTNTAERRVAARRVLEHLLEAGAIGAITTHDLELLDASLAEAAVPVHFRETIRGGEDGGMTFDYTLRPGLATSTNALALMRLVGLD